MKRHINPLRQPPRNRFGSFHAARSNLTPRSSTSLGTADGYDWLRQIKPVQAGRAARP